MVMAELYVNCGQYENALDEIEQALSQETLITTNTLKLTSWIDPIRELPRYKELIERYKI